MGNIQTTARMCHLVDHKNQHVFEMLVDLPTRITPWSLFWFRSIMLNNMKMKNLPAMKEYYETNNLPKLQKIEDCSLIFEYTMPFTGELVKDVTDDLGNTSVESYLDKGYKKVVLA